MTVRKYVYVTYHFADTRPTLAAILSGELAAKRLSSVSSAEAKFCGHKFKDEGQERQL
jgi:hypothetical protein